MSGDDRVPVTLLCGFLGAGKTTLLKHILETKHSDEVFNAAVIVNDMAELNIDKSLIDNTSLIQSDEAMIGMQNGCICCTLQSDLVEQIIGLTQKKKFNYILIEASGVSEPHEIAPLFDIANFEDHPEDDGHDHSKPQLGEVARLDTCVTVMDSAEFYNNLGSMKTFDNCDIQGTIAELMMDQVEFANVILLNKDDLVNKEQQKDILDKLALLNPQAKIFKSVHCKIDVLDILNTNVYTNKEAFWVTSTKHETNMKEYSEEGQPEACTARFDIKSFVYRARKPFHPKRLFEQMLLPYFADQNEVEEDEEEPEEEMKEGEESEEKISEEQKKRFIAELMEKAKQDKQIAFEKLQAIALEKQKVRQAVFGELLRSKGFLWLATSNDLMADWQQAGNVVRIRAETQWLCEQPEVWEGTPVEDLVRKDMQNEHGEYWPYKDRRQEIVFIGHMMNKEAIESILNECLLTDEEMSLGPEKWKETMDEYDVFQLKLDDFIEMEQDEVDNDGKDENSNKTDQMQICEENACKVEECDR